MNVGEPGQRKTARAVPDASGLAEAKKSAGTEKPAGAENAASIEAKAEAGKAAAGPVLGAGTGFTKAEARPAPAAPAKMLESKLASRDLFGSKSKTAQPPGSSLHVLKKGETLSKVAKQHGLSLEALREANPQIKKEDEGRLPVGAKINVPAAPDSKSEGADKAGKREKPPKARDPRRYTPDDLKRLTGQDGGYTKLDGWVNTVAQGEGRFEDAAILEDKAGLSVGLLQWTQSGGELGKLMQDYHKTAEREGRLEEFHEAFGGKEKAEELLQTLASKSDATRMSLRPEDLRSLFAEAGKIDMFQRAQIEKARTDIRKRMDQAFDQHPYVQADGSLSAQSMAISTIVANIGPRLLGSACKRTVDELYTGLRQQNPDIEKPLGGKAATDEFKRQAVLANVSEAAFDEHLAGLAPEVLYKRQATYDANHKGLERRLRAARRHFKPEERVSPSDL